MGTQFGNFFNGPVSPTPPLSSPISTELHVSGTASPLSRPRPCFGKSNPKLNSPLFKRFCSK
ncbi:hypothetical protein COLO4_29213 [Corchorus olitorius]|uniref:Uncharacterized protein n=1 Tax=Corchorus olitorius TaxID=93759 RepID=A0A1R3HFV8_9ROSI|nr:hypothetical protein COLO4_29213 [Corchorus olitorius]